MVTVAQEIDPVPRAILDAQLRDAVADWLDVAGVSRGQPVNADENSRRRAAIFEFAHPSIESRGCNDLNHMSTVVHSLQSGNLRFCMSRLHYACQLNLRQPRSRPAHQRPFTDR